VVIDDFNIVRIAVGPDEANPKLIVHADAVLSRAVSFQRFQLIPWQGKIVEGLGLIYLISSAPSSRSPANVS